MSQRLSQVDCPCRLFMEGKEENRAVNRMPQRSSKRLCLWLSVFVSVKFGEHKWHTFLSFSGLK